MTQQRSIPLQLAGWAMRRAWVGLVIVAVAGCSMLGDGGAKPVPQDLGTNIPVLGVKQAWIARVGSVAAMASEIHVHGDAVTVASADGTIAAINARTGQEMWRLQLNEPLAAGVGFDGKWTAVISRSNALIAVENAQERWRQTLPAQVFTAPLVAGGRVFVLAADRSVLAFDASNGQRLWTQQRAGEPLVLRQAGVMLAVGDTLVVGLSGRLVGLNPDNGSVRWETPLASPRGTNDVERLVELVGRVSRVGESVCARAFQASVGCVNSARGTLNWAMPANGSEGIHGDGQAIFGTESNGSVIAWKRADGSRLWGTDRLRYRKLSAPLLLGRSVVVGDDTGWVHFFSREDGAPLNRLATDGSGIAAAPVVAADTLVVMTRNGTLYGFRPD